jgi:Flp pilus assembly protein TadB
MTGGLVAPRLDVLLVVLLGAAVGGGLALLVVALVPRPQAPPTATLLSAGPAGGVVARVRRLGRRGVVALVAGVGTLVVTRWPVAAGAAALLALAWPALFGGVAAERRASAKVEALAVWTESLRDTIAGAVGLEQAVIASSHAPPGPIAAELRALADRLRVRIAMPEALRRFADDLADPSADLIIATLVLNARLRGPGLREVLSSLAESARAEVEMRGRVAAGRASTRRSVQIVVGVTLLFVSGLALFNRSYVAPYGTALGQVVLLVIVGLFAAGFFWLRRLSRFDEPGRLLVGTPGGAR